MTAKEHYDQHLGGFYSWIAGDFHAKQQEHQQFLEEQHIIPLSTKAAIDLGAGHGIQSVSLAKLGFEVKAIDFNLQLLSELHQNSGELAIAVIEDDIRSFSKYIEIEPELIICWGDTLTHLDNEKEIGRLLAYCCKALAKNGKLILSFRDYSVELLGDNRFIPVKSDAERILTCFLEYAAGYVRVTDLLYEKEGSGWKQRISSYYKVRIPALAVKNHLVDSGMKIIFNDVVSGLNTIIAVK